MRERGLIAGLPEGRSRAARRDHRPGAPDGGRACATCAPCSGPRSTTTTAATSISSRSRRRWPGGEVKVLVAIADVDALVKKGTPLDDRAAQNTTSVYTAGGVFPMLPEKLSTDLTSLNQDEDRLAVVIEYVVDADGALDDSDVYSRRRAQQGEARVQLGGRVARRTRAECPKRWRRSRAIDTQIRLQEDVSQRQPRVRRYEQGALDLETIEARAVFEGEEITRPDGGSAESAATAHRGFHDRGERRDGALSSSRRGFARSRRVVRSPESWHRIVSVASEYGFPLPQEPDAKALEGFLAARRKADPQRFPDLSLVIVKLMGAGEYVVELPGQAADRALRARRAGLHALDGAESPVSRRHHAAPPQGRARTRARPPTPSRSSTDSRSIAPSRRTPRTRSSASCARPRPRCSSRPASASGSTES